LGTNFAGESGNLSVAAGHQRWDRLKRSNEVQGSGSPLILADICKEICYKSRSK
jgi:hypothetical protein